MAMNKFAFYLCLVWLGVAGASGQEIKIQGQVLDRNTHRPIAYANIYLKDTPIGTISDFAGKFSLVVGQPSPQMMLILQHINYDRQEISLRDAQTLRTFYLQPRVIPLPEVQVEARSERLAIEQDLPQAVSILKANAFDIRGYVDAGDLLRTDQSVQVEEDLSGRKTVSLRGGNPEDVVVLYNGVKLNSEYNNLFDLSAIDLEDVERFELIKGSNSVLYGAEAFSGVINIVPRIRQDYALRFQQRLGTYDSGNWGLHLYQQWRRFHGSYQIREGGAERQFRDETNNTGVLQNRSSHHTANIEYELPDQGSSLPKTTVGLMYLYSTMDYQKDAWQDYESLANSNRLVGLRLSGELFRLNQIHLAISQRWLRESLLVASDWGTVDRDVNDRALNIHAEKSFRWDKMELLLAYQLEQAALAFDDGRNRGPSPATMTDRARLRRTRQGLISIIKMHAPTGSDILKKVDFDVSIRRDLIRDDYTDLELGKLSGHIAPSNRWDRTMVKFASYFSGYHQHFAFDIFMNIGSNFKAPTLSQIISAQAIAATGVLKLEKNHSLEIGALLKRDIPNNPFIYGWQLSGNYMKMHYDNKLRSYYFVGIPYAYYDNVPIASISGLETRATTFFLKKKMTLELGLSSYSISDKSAFPFKYDFKQIVNWQIDHAGYSFQLHWFTEGEQIGWIRQYSDRFVQVILPEYSNIDLHLGKTFSWGRLKLFGNISLRNLLSDEFELEGIALRDRRYYVTLGAQY